MLAICASCKEPIESADWLLLRGEVYHDSGSCRDLCLRRRADDALDRLRAELSYICERLHSPHGGSLWDCGQEPCKSIILPALTIDGPAYKQAGLLAGRHSSKHILVQKRRLEGGSDA